ncbi:MAG: NapC/NirT family cytochrome c [Gammaproteobacteria bacterium]
MFDLAELKLTAHDLNCTGVRASCADCNVPRESNAKMAAKLRASKDLLGHFSGNRYPGKYTTTRLAMAQAVWSYMKATDSRDCQDCHSLSAMALDEQQGRVRRSTNACWQRGRAVMRDFRRRFSTPQDLPRIPKEYEGISENVASFRKIWCRAAGHGAPTR